MKVRVLFLAVVCAIMALVATVGQTNINQGASQPPVDESQPETVAVPAAENEPTGEGRPLAPHAPDDSSRTQTEQSMQLQSAEPAQEAVTAQEPLLPQDTRKRWRIIPLALAGVVYDDNIFLTTENRVADVIWTLSAGLAFELGDFRGTTENYLSAYWLGIPVIYTNNPEQNAFNQSAALVAQYRWNRLVARLQSNFAITTGANREVNTITTTKSFSNSLRFQYDYSDKTSFDLSGSQVATLQESFQNTNQYEIKVGMDYQLFPKTRIGVAGVGGVLDSASEPLRSYQQALVRIYYSASGKLAVKLNGGVEVREFAGGGDNKMSPIFGLGVEYHPFDGTSLSVAAYRNVVGSNAVGGQDFTATGFAISAQQRFFQKFIAAVSFGYETDVYFSTGNAPPTDRVDNYLYVSPRLSYSFVKWLSASAFYEYRQQNSTGANNGFFDNRVGMELALRF